MAELILRPTGDSAPGFSSASPSSSHWENVDDTVADEYTSYNLTTGTEEDIYTFEDHGSASGTINSVIVYASILHNYTEDVIKLKVGSGYSASLDNGDGWRSYSYNPGGSWTWALVDAITAGVRGEVATDRVAISQIYIVVDYTPATTPTVTTSAVSSVASTQAVGGGNITSTGGAAVTERGVCYNTTGTPTTSSSKVYDSGSYGTGVYSKTISGLTPGTLYYARAYAINAYGTVYGSEVTFTTTAGGLFVFHG